MAFTTAVFGMTLKVHSCGQVSPSPSPNPQHPKPKKTIKFSITQQKKPHLLMPKLNQIPIIRHHLPPMTLRPLKQLRQRKPLPRHLIPIIRIDKLVIIDAVRRIALDALDRRLHLVQRDDILDQGLARRRQRDGLGGIGRVVAGGVRLADFEVLAGEGGVGGEVGFAAVGVGGRRGGGGGGGGHGAFWGCGARRRYLGLGCGLG